MKTKNMLVAAILVSSAGLTAFSINASANSDVPAGKTRAEVKAELIQARADGWRPSGEEAENFFPTTVKSTKTRAEVKAELIQARADGWKPSDEEYENFFPAPVKSTKTRAEVKTELMQYLAEKKASGQSVSPEE